MSGEKIRVDTMIAYLSQAFYKLTGFLILALLARYLAKDDMGAFFFAATFTSLGALLTELGTNAHLTRSISADPAGARRAVSDVLSLRIPLAATCFVAITLFALLFRREIWILVLLSSIYALIEQIYHSFGALFLGSRRVVFNVTSGMISRGLLVALILFAVRHRFDVLGVAACYITADTVMLVIAVALSRRIVPGIRPHWAPRAALSLAHITFPLFAMQLLTMIHFRIDSVMIGFLRDYADVATYESSFRLLEASRFIVLPLSMIFFPLFSEIAGKGNWYELKRFVFRLTGAAALAGGVMAITVIAGAAVIIPAVFGNGYGESIPVLRVLFLSVPMIFAARVATFSANAMHLEKRCVPVLLACTMINVALNGAAIPIWGAGGAAVTTVISETILAVWLIVLVRNEADRRIAGATNGGAVGGR